MGSYRFSGVPLEAQYRLRQGREYARKGNDSAALVCFRQVLCLAPAFSGAHVEMGDCLCRLGRFEEATWYYKKAGQDGRLSGTPAFSPKFPDRPPR